MDKHTATFTVKWEIDDQGIRCEMIIDGKNYEAGVKIPNPAPLDTASVVQTLKDRVTDTMFKSLPVPWPIVATAAEWSERRTRGEFVEFRPGSPVRLP